MYSISKQLTLLLICSLTLIVFSAAIQGYRSSTEISSRTYDDELKVVAQGLVPIAINWNIINPSNTAGEPEQLLISKEAMPALTARTLNQSVEFAYQIVVNKKAVIRTENAPTDPIGELQHGFSDVSFSGKRWRLFTVEFTENEWILVAQQRKLRGLIVEEMILAAVKPIIWVMPFLGVLIFLITTRSLAPLKQLSRDLQTRQSNNLSKLNINNRSTELEPVIQTLNLLFARLASSFEREREFVSHAAHELRTPLSVMKINLHNLQNNPSDLNTDLPKLQEDVERMIQAVNQLLMLSKTNPELLLQDREKVDLLETCQSVIGDLYPHIEQKQQTIELIGDHQFVFSKPFLMQTLISNLITNAIKYSPDHGLIRVDVSQVATNTFVTIEDSGPGIPVAMRENVLKRFYRSDDAVNKGILGSGLGLTIVAQILATHGANLTFSDSELGGLSVQVKFTADDGLPNLL
ncbi:ATP-binding protein [Brumicola pallidula]|jgi:two-component system sensor histidine kinase QseC|uniref:histidine kinase n=1 Tax=Brumicola pallidula DSM 14239 = ACAM 615 TaxID=1121922 RepID=K6YZN4_9ALTE|nr:ATP-binding protein [Glaciecola pallidula]GAC29396.1 two-component system, OmpR family, sensor histidine kinase QseC [Glaciecola pallidula DSM 14239 = ACAM 615]